MIDFSQLPDVAPDYDLRDLLEAGCHFGHQASKWHPSMDEWIYAQQDGTHIFDLEKTAQQLRLAYNYLYHLGQNNQDVIFVGTKRQARELVKAQAQTAGAFWISSRWLGGLMTNWTQIKKSLQKMIDIEQGLESDEFKMYTKYEQTQLEKEAGRLARFFDGLRGMKTLPDAIVIIDPNKERIVIDEAQIMEVPVVGLVDTNTNPEGIELVIPANDDGRGSIELIITELTNAYAQGRAAQGEKPVRQTKAETPAPEQSEAEKAEKPVQKEAPAKKKPVAKKEKKAKPEVTVVKPSMSLKRAELDDLAKKIGVKEPQKLLHKQAVIDAISQAQKEE